MLYKSYKNSFFIGILENIQKKDHNSINELLGHFSDGESSGYESPTTADLEISTTIGKHQNDHLKENCQCYGMRHFRICCVQCMSTTLMFLVCICQ